MPGFVSRFLFTALISSAALAGESAFVDGESITWKGNAHSVSRFKTLVGGNEGGQLDNEDVQSGLWQLAPGATYHGHKHDAPEIYYIVSGEADWTVGDETRRVKPGTAIYTKPGKVHRMVNAGDDIVEAVWFWWAPDGRREVFNGEYVFTEPAPKGQKGFSRVKEIY